MPTIAKEEVDLGVGLPGVITAVRLAHVAWCEEMDRTHPGWGKQYLPFLDFSRPNSRAMRLCIASVMVVVKKLDSDPRSLFDPKVEPVVAAEELSGNLFNPLLYELMELANDAWDDEAERLTRIRKPRVEFIAKFRTCGQGDPRRLYVASQLAVLKCVPNVTVGRNFIMKTSSVLTPIALA